ncbi:hypothetical protein [Mucilaginibacter sp. SG538B]|uniref:hypothetical protein n=1 Tax=Mucilaginibacter sp. SG538B TaxID=2587021 RepID=UPI00159DF4D5|nr:hypothetical protein [Mucilaginibacter sp. SG538B]
MKNFISAWGLKMFGNVYFYCYDPFDYSVNQVTNGQLETGSAINGNWVLFKKERDPIPGVYKKALLKAQYRFQILIAFGTNAVTSRLSSDALLLIDPNHKSKNCDCKSEDCLASLRYQGHK